MTKIQNKKLFIELILLLYCTQQIVQLINNNSLYLSLKQAIIQHVLITALAFIQSFIRHNLTNYSMAIFYTLKYNTVFNEYLNI